MNFATKAQFRLNLLHLFQFIAKWTGNQFPIIKGIILTNYFEIIRKFTYKRNTENWRLMGRIIRTRRLSYCYYGNGQCWQRNKYTSDIWCMDV